MKRASALLAGFLVAGFAGGQSAGDKRAPAEAKGGSFAESVLRLSLLRPGSLCPSSGDIAYGQTISGTLSAPDCQLPDHSFVDYFQFEGTQGQTVSIDMTSTAFDTYLSLLNPASVEVAKNNDFSGTNSHITFTLTSSGTWTIAANSVLGNETGNYQLSLALVTTPPPPACGDATTLCLTDDRFRVSVAWHTTDGRSGSGQAISLSSDTGYFWFFSAANVELVVKVLDGRAINNHFWVFYGALSDVQYVITVRDTTSGATKSYSNPQGNLASVADTMAF